MYMYIADCLFQFECGDRRGAAGGGGGHGGRRQVVAALRFPRRDGENIWSRQCHGQSLTGHHASYVTTSTVSWLTY